MYQGKFSTGGERGGRRRRMGRLLAALALVLAVFTVALSGLALYQRAANRGLTGRIEKLEQEKEELAQQLEEAVGNQPPAQTGTAGLEYQELYADLYADPPEEYVTPPAKTVFLTFDDGPSDNTVKILDLLDQYGAKATFFVTGTNITGREALLKDIVQRGHTLAVHTYSHDYKAIYASVEAFLDDFSKVYNQIVAATARRPPSSAFPAAASTATTRFTISASSPR